MKKLLLVLISFISLQGFAQTGSVRGFVYEKSNGEPSIFTNLALEGTTIGTSTDVNGYFSITKIPPGTYKLVVSALGFETITQSITVTKGKISTRKFYMEETVTTLEEFEVTGEKKEAQSQVKMSVTKITPKDIQKLPSVGGEADIAQYLQVVPGVIFTGDQGGQLYIRGGSPIQNKVLLDGMVVYNPFHSIGLFSVFDTDIIRNADVHTGGFNAEYGGRISSIMDITTRDGNKTRLSGKISASPFGSKALIEGPLSKYKEGKGSSSSFVFSGKTSYLEESSKILYTYISEDGLPFNFTDLYGKLSFNGRNGSKFNAFGFNFTDQVRYQAVQNLNWEASGGGVSFVVIPPGSPVLIQGNFSSSNYQITLEEIGQQARSSEISSFNMGLDFKYFIDDDEIKYGIEALGYGTNFNFRNTVGRQITQEESTTELAGYLVYKIKSKNLVLEPSFRAQYFASLSVFNPEPRIGIKYNVTENIRIKAAGGRYSQNLISANSDRDVVNLFYGFLAGPDNLQDEYLDQNGNTVEVKNQLQKASHYIAGFELDLSNKIKVNVEGYMKDFTQLTNINRNKIFDDNLLNADKPDLLKKDFIVETGTARGIDFVFKYNTKKTYLWAVYSLGKVDRWDGFTEYSPVFDRRHNVNLLGTYIFGKDDVWEASARYNLGSGLPFTQTRGYNENVDFNTDGIGTDYVTSNGNLNIIYSNLNEGRLPTYIRMDMNLKRKIEFEKSKMEVTAGITNILNRENIFYFDRVRFERVNQLPFMPSIGFSWEF